MHSNIVPYPLLSASYIYFPDMFRNILSVTLQCITLGHKTRIGIITSHINWGIVPKGYSGYSGHDLVMTVSPARFNFNFFRPWVEQRQRRKQVLRPKIVDVTVGVWISQRMTRKQVCLRRFEVIRNGFVGHASSV